jgi:leukotriene-A4 hydrolase
MARLDPHSYADDAQPRTRSFAFAASVDFEARVLHAELTLRFVTPAAGGALDLDTRALSIDAITGPAGEPLAHTLHPAEPILGSRLEIAVPAGAVTIHIRYRTSPEASALQWLTPEQTLGKKEPHLFSQCQALHARSVLPCQDTPSIRQTFTASLDVPAPLRAVMGAAFVAREVNGDRAVERFEMPQAIPPYLFAFAVGDLASKDLSPRSRVWSEPAQLEAAAWEFAHVEDHLRAAEALFGPYDWERFDLLVMPPSFPYGGMENPRLTFLTPSLLVGDRSLVNVVAHELAHSWTGNLVTNATAEHFWLNEGFTVYAERRILEAIDGAEMAALHAAIGYEKLLEAFVLLARTPELTKLRTHLTGVDPDEAFSVVPYEKGYLFLKTLEAAAGGKAFEALLATWLRAHRFGSVTTEDFLALVEQELPGLLAKVDASAWIDGPLLPPHLWKPASARLAAIEAIDNRVPTKEESKSWSATEWHLYLERMPRPATPETCTQLDSLYGLTSAKNPEVLVSWLLLACASGYAPVLPRVEEVLGQTGRMKYVKPLYRALRMRAETAQLARDLFARYASQYHPIAQEVLRGILK